MTNPWLPRLGNLLWYQCIWFTAVLGGDAWLGLGLTLLVVHLWWVDDWREQALLMLAAAALGGGVDLLVAGAGYYRFAPATTFGATPLWLFLIWMGFAGTLRHSMAWLADRPRLMTTAALLGAPMAYISAARFGAVSFPSGTLSTGLITALSWLCVLPLLLTLNNLLKQRAARPAAIDNESLAADRHG